MLTYLGLAAGVGVPLAAVGAVVLRRSDQGASPAAPGRRFAAALVALAVLLALTAVFDTVIVGTGIVAYDPDRILGFRIGAAPVEDFAYPLAAALALPALWCVLPRRGE